MKTLLGTIILLFAMQTVSTAQCAINFEKNFRNKAEGTYLKHFEYKTKSQASRNTTFLLRRGINYKIYLQNPSIPIADVKLWVYKNEEETPIELNSEINLKENYSVHRFNTEKGGTGAYNISIEFPIESVKNCVVVALYLD